MGAFGWPHLLIILAVILLLFGAAKLPALAKSLGETHFSAGPQSANG